MGSLPQDAQSKAISYFDRMGKLNLMSGVMGLNSLKQNQQEQQRNQEAESQWVRKNVWEDDSQAGEDMGDQTILGDVTNPTPIVIQGGGGNNGNSLLTLALGAVLGGGGIWLGQFLSEPVTPTPQQVNQEPATETGIGLGLGKLSDFE